MAHIITVHLLVDEVPGKGDSMVFDGLNEMFRAAQEPVDPDNPDETPFVLDWYFGECKPVSNELADAIVNDTYEEGDFVLETNLDGS